MWHRRSIGTLLLVVLLGWLPAAAAKKRDGLRLHRDLPRDPLIVWGVWLEHSPGEFGWLVDLVGRYFPGTGDPRVAGPLARVDRAMSRTLDVELLPRLGPELLLSVDFPPVDQAVAALHLAGGEGLATLLSRIGVLARVRDVQGLDRALRRAIVDGGGTVRESDGLVEVELPFAAGATETRSSLHVYYAFRGDRWALAFSAAWVEAALSPRPAGQSLTDGGDYKKVFGNLDPRPNDLAYINLPRLRAIVNESQVVQMVLQSNPDLRAFFDRFFKDDTLGVGLGSTSVRVADGVRTTHFGPAWMSGAAISSGFLTAMALPSLLSAVDRGRNRRTVTDIKAIADACEGFSSDARNYPGPTEGWVPVDRIATFLEPVYIGQLPRTDGWENPILYWSDGGSYRIISTGRDGRIDQDWTGTVDPTALAGQDADIVFGDGELLVWPSDLGPD
jgi:type II secretory pathway pseudopilin PulG